MGERENLGPECECSLKVKQTPHKGSDRGSNPRVHTNKGVIEK